MLNNQPQMFRIYFQPNYFYPEVNEVWKNVVLRMPHQYMSIEDFMNAQIKSISFPAISGNTKSQQLGQYEIDKRPGKPVGAILNKTFNLSIKLTESYATYLIMRQQYTLYLKLIETKELYWPPVILEFLNDSGHAYYRSVYGQITPNSMSELSLNYSATLAQHTEFSMNFNFNYLEEYINYNGDFIKL